MTYDDAYIEHVAAIYAASPALSRVVMSFETFIALRWLADNTLPQMNCRCVVVAIPKDCQKFLPLLPAQLAVQAAVDRGQEAAA